MSILYPLYIHTFWCLILYYLFLYSFVLEFTIWNLLWKVGRIFLRTKCFSVAPQNIFKRDKSYELPPLVDAHGRGHKVAIIKPRKRTLGTTEPEPEIFESEEGDFSDWFTICHSVYLTIFFFFIFTNMIYLSKEKDCNLHTLITNHMFYPFPNLTKLFLLVNIVSMFLDIRLIRHIYFINFDICIHKEKRKIQTQNVPKAQNLWLIKYLTSM